MKPPTLSHKLSFVSSQLASLNHALLIFVIRMGYKDRLPITLRTYSSTFVCCNSLNGCVHKRITCRCCKFGVDILILFLEDVEKRCFSK